MYEYNKFQRKLLEDMNYSVVDDMKKGFRINFENKYLYAYKKALDIYTSEFMDYSLQIEPCKEYQDYYTLIRENGSSDLTVFWDLVKVFKKEIEH